MEQINQFLKEAEENGLLRILHPADYRRNGVICIEGREYADFSSNDYLGLSHHAYIKSASCNIIEKLGASSSASRLLSGSLTLHSELEDRTASFKGKEAALIFNSGYQANIGIISSLCSRGDVVFTDKLSHASIIDGVLLSGAKLFRFLHNDAGSLESLLKTHRQKFKNALIITETVFSMDGDIAPLKDLVSIKEEYNCQIMIDEAHATGVFGDSGSGIAEKENLTDSIDLIMGTFSKALGSFGAYLACSKNIKDYLINTSRSFIYSTALPPSVIAANLASLELIKKEPFRRRELLQKASYFRNELSSLRLTVKGSSQIIPLIVKDSRKAVKISSLLKEKGFWAPAIRPPTVPANEARIRFSLSYCHTKDVLDRLINDIYEINEF
ncbi:MAG: 8-amino-7-oxononanoate synthase [Candidatus Omnitrophota bacterium]